VDRYKYEVYSRLENRTVFECLTLDASSTRLHACERFDRCKYAPKEGTIDGQTVVYVNPVTFSVEKWAAYEKKMTRNLRSGKLPSCLVSVDFEANPHSR
jgi:DNA cross-link repair 1C protein